MIFMPSFENLFFFFLASVGLTAILVDGKIFAPFRDFLARRVDRIFEKRENGKKIGWNPSEFLFNIITCYQCCGFWSGLFCGLLVFLGNLARGLHGEWMQEMIPLLIFLFFCGWASSLLSVIFAVLLDYIRSRIPQEHIHEEHLQNEAPDFDQ